MKKESIIRKVKENKKLLLICSIIFISGLIIGISISMVQLPKSEPKYYIATEDVRIHGDDIARGNPPSGFYGVRISDVPEAHSLRFGVSGLGTANPNYYGFLMIFDLRNNPKSWSKCEISLYVFDDSMYTVSGSMYLFEGNWSETSAGAKMNELDIYWEIEDPIGGVNNHQIGFDRTDITEYINDMSTDTFSIVIYIKKIHYNNGGGSIYSSEWDGIDPIFPHILPENDSYLNYLPQLIYS